MAPHDLTQWSGDAQKLLQRALRDQTVSQSDLDILFETLDADQIRAFTRQLGEMDIEIFNDDEEGDLLLDDEDDPDMSLPESDLDADDMLDEMEDEDSDDENGHAARQAVSISTLELTNDPVRMYLKEIGQVQLLDSNQESWLSAQMAASLRIDETYAELEETQQDVSSRHVLLDLFRQMEVAWQDVEVLAASFNVAPPNCGDLIAEARQLREHWWSKLSYMHQYLSLKDWGRNEEWTQLARRLFAVFETLYVMPVGVQRRLTEFYERNGKLPAIRTFGRWLEADFPDEVIEDEFNAVHDRALDASAALTRANLRLVVSVAKK